MKYEKWQNWEIGTQFSGQYSKIAYLTTELTEIESSVSEKKTYNR